MFLSATASGLMPLWTIEYNQRCTQQTGHTRHTCQSYSTRRDRDGVTLTYLLTYLRTHPVIIGEDDVDVDDRSSLVRCQDVPFAVRGAVGDRSVFLALFTTNSAFKPNKGKTYRVRVGVGVVLRRGNVSTGERRTYIRVAEGVNGI